MPLAYPVPASRMGLHQEENNVLQKLTDLPAGIEGVIATGTVSKEDYERVFVPLMDAARRGGTRLRLLYEFDPDFKGFTPGAAWEDAKLSRQSMRLFEGCAVAADSVPSPGRQRQAALCP